MNWGSWEILDDPDPADLVDLQIEHMRYYQTAPIFLVKDDTPKVAHSQLQQALDDGDRLLAAVVGGRISGLFVVGSSVAEAKDCCYEARILPR